MEEDLRIATEKEGKTKDELIELQRLLLEAKN